MTVSLTKLTTSKKNRQKVTSTSIGSNYPEAAIVAEGIEMTFESGKQYYQVLRGIDLVIKSGDIQLLMGPSGSGKTTLLSILAGLLTPTEGQVYLLGQEITRMSREKLAKYRLENVGFI